MVNALGNCPLFAMENRFATFSNLVPFSRENLQSLPIGWFRERRCEASAIGSELSVEGKQVHGCHHLTG
jgi:hypothetical protein